jgi:hypothetical protein
MRILIALAATLQLAGCGDGGQTFDVSGNRLVIKDGSYISRPTGYFCGAGGMGQIKMTLVDYKPACKLDVKEGDPDPRKEGEAHSELELLIMNLTNHLNLMVPFKVGPADCTIGPVEEVQATYRHYPAGSMTPDVTITNGTGTVMLDQYDKFNQKPALGRFNITIGGSTLDGTFDSGSCDPP